MIGARAALLAIVLTPLGACSGTDRDADVARVAAPRAELSGPELYDTRCADCHRAPGQTRPGPVAVGDESPVGRVNHVLDGQWHDAY